MVVNLPIRPVFPPIVSNCLQTQPYFSGICFPSPYPDAPAQPDTRPTRIGRRRWRRGVYCLSIRRHIEGGSRKAMPYIALHPEAYNNTRVGSGQCVAFVQKASGAPMTSLWKRGAQVKGNPGVLKGTAIATFEGNGKYGNTTDGSSHGAIFVGQNAEGLQVWDQWIGQPVHQRTIHYRGAALGTRPVNDGDAFYVIE